MTLDARIFRSFAEIDPAAWDACFPGEAESHAYYAACEQGASRTTQDGAAAVFVDGRLVAAAPIFKTVFRLDTPIQGPLRRLTERFHPLVKGIMDLPIIGLGCPYSERCHLGFAPDADPSTRRALLISLLARLEEYARREGTGLIALKDLAAQDEAEFGAAITTQGWTRAASLPTAILDLPFHDLDAYLAGLSAVTRKDIRRKLRSAPSLRIEWRSDFDGLEDEIALLYASTRRRSRLDYGDFETLPNGYFSAVMRSLGERARVVLYWVGDTLCAFNLVFLEKDRMIDKFLGMRYPLGQEHNVYAVSWMENVKECLARGIGCLQTGQTAYGLKLRYGSRLQPSYIYFKHRSALPYAILKTVSRFMKADRLDPDLRAARAFTS
ncbi:Predicted N-acyltransferase [Rhizobiales bacterium GAS113]|nr:Predicted N-acyltransferase [Rhizobiales bacterium GAS113]